MDDIIEISYIKNEKWKEDNDEKHGYAMLIGDQMSIYSEWIIPRLRILILSNFIYLFS